MAAGGLQFHVMPRDRRAAWWYFLIAAGALSAAWYFLRDIPADVPDWVYGLWN